MVLSLFDAERDLPWHRSIRRYFDVIHYNKLIALGGVRATRSFDELEAAISTYLDQPHQDAEARAHTRAQESYNFVYCMLYEVITSGLTPVLSRHQTLSVLGRQEDTFSRVHLFRPGMSAW